MPLFRASGESGGVKPRQRRMRNRKTDEDGSVLSLTRLCLLSLADNMNDVWAKDYADNYLDHYFFRHIMGPFNLLSGERVEELTHLLCNRKQLSRAALHLLLVPQLRALSLEKCPGLVTSALCAHVSARCQGLWSLDLSGAQQLPSKAVSETLICLPALRSLSLSGTLCDGCVIRTVARHCRFLRHLDVSRCHFLSPAALLPLGGGASIVSYGCPSSVSNSSSKSPTFPSLPAHFSPPPLCSLLALDIGFGKEEGDLVAAAAFLLLSLPFLERVAMEGLAQACCLIQNRHFSKTNEFTDREGVPRLGEVWRHRQVMDKWSKKREVEEDEKEKKEEEEEEGEILWEGYSSDSRDEGPNSSQSQTEKKRRGSVLSQSDDDHLILSLKDVKAVSCDSLDSLSQLCPNIHSISVNIDDDGDEVTGGRSQGSLLAASLNTWSGQLRNLSLHYLGPLLDLLPALQISGSSLVSLTLEGVKTSPHTPLLEIIKACPRLRDLLMFAEPPTTPQEHEDDEMGEQQDDQDLPQLSNLCSLTLKFSYEHSRMKPIMSWMSLKKVLKSLFLGSPSLEKLSLVSLPCPLNCVLQDVLHRADLALHLYVDSTGVPPMPLGRLQHINLQRTDVEMTTVKSLMQRTKRLKCIDVSYCWKISKAECFNCVTTSKVQLVWS
ncbi:uncharacterized protein si:ch211-214j8.12 isoform X1 [Labrus mixtus]|uniref:uncharacterized protein si:ch211-214j8.12 isoform X1 n=1 Tax=Labrus mixtus TaxID=508554 RepID=UPI0029C0EC90|nr:uncharacterized protein si:ch211-214j8.12 isoform X1 [Labrus mixtus]